MKTSIFHPIGGEDISLNNSHRKIAWIHDWIGPYEGGATLLMKFAWANALNAQQLCSELFGKNMLISYSESIHGRSLLCPIWIQSNETQKNRTLGSIIASSGLNFYSGWVQKIAADTHFRYCPICISYGYQSLFFQIDALAICPIHHVRIIQICINCGAPTPRYAITPETLDNPFHCNSCGCPYGEKFNPHVWRAIELHREIKSAFRPLIQWLIRLDRAKLNWFQWSEWFGSWLGETDRLERRLATFSVLQRLVPITFNTQFLRLSSKPFSIKTGTLRNVKKNNFETPLKKDFPPRYVIYKSIRRHFMKVTHQLWRNFRSTGGEDIEISWVNEILKLSLDRDPYFQSILLWRFRFEKMEGSHYLDFKKRGTLILRESGLNWPWNGCADDTAWAGYVLVSFYAAMEIVKCWWEKASILRDSKVPDIDRSKEMALYGEFAASLSPRLLPVPSSITLVTNTSVEGGKPTSLYVIGPHIDDISTSIYFTEKCQ